VLQKKSLLSPLHTERISINTPSSIDDTPSTISPQSISSLSSFTFDSSELVEKFKLAFKKYVEWQEVKSKGDESFLVEENLIFHHG